MARPANDGRLVMSRPIRIESGEKIVNFSGAVAAAMAAFLKSRRAVYAVTAGYACLLVCLTHWPQLPEVGMGGDVMPVDKIIHGGLYAVLGFLASCTTWAGTRWRRISAPAVLLALAVFAAADEVTQSLTLRSPDFFDWVADLGGAACGVALARAAKRLIRPRVGRSDAAPDACEPIP